MSRLETALPAVPNAALIPHYHPPGACCLNCEHWEQSANPNVGRCRMFEEERNSDWSCIIFRERGDA